MTDTERVEEATRSFLADHPDREETLETILALEREQDSWEFDDLALDSGEFGELVSREFVEQTDDGNYRFSDRDAVATVLDGETAETETETTDTASDTDFDLDVSLPSVDRRALGGLLGVLALVVAARSLFYRSVFRDGHVVSPANDPYFYRYWQTELLERSGGATDLGMLATIGEQTRIRPLSHALNWWFAEFLGGSAGTAGMVAAAQPIVATLLLAIALYGLVIKLTADHRIALGSVLLLALTPVHVVYTGLGFLEHRPYQYLWIGVMAATLGWLAVDLHRRFEAGDKTPGWDHTRNPTAWAIAGILAIAVGGMAHTWGGSPLSYLPIALYMALRVVMDCRAEVDPLPANLPALVGITVGSLVALGAHRRWGWQESIAGTVPVAVAAGAVGVALLGTLWLRLDLPTAGLLAAEGIIGTIVVLLFRQLRPDDVARLQERSDALFGRDTAIETASLFTTEYAIIFGPLAQIGIGFYLGLIPLGIATYYVAREYQPAWLATVCFTWFYLVLAAIQVRFAAQLSIFFAIFGAVGLVYLLGALDLARPPTLFERVRPSGHSLELPSTPTAGGYLVGMLVGVLIFNLIFVPTLLSQTQYSDEQFEAAMVIDDHAEEYDLDYRDNFVLSDWGDNRMYNYFVSGESRGYGYAQSNHQPFISDTSPDEYYNQFSGRVGYVVLTDLDAPEESVQAQLFDEFGVGNQTTSHYQLLYAGEEVRVFTVVPGATITVDADPGETVAAETTVQQAGQEFTYEQTATADDNGVAQLRVAYPGTYELNGMTVTVSDDDVHDGTELSAEQ